MMRQDWEETLEMAAFAPPLMLAERAAPPSAYDTDTGREMALRAGESLLAAIERHDPASPMVGCRGGGCGVCRVQLLAGRVELGKMSRRFVTIDMERERYALACRVYPQGEISYRLAPLDPRTC